jgi:ATP phosphoribosyltransferase regulatory subunit
MSSHFSPEERPLRLSYADKVYLTPQKPETSLERFQIGAELLGWEEEGADVEMLFLLLKYLEDIRISDAVIVIGDVTILQNLLERVPSRHSKRIVNALISGNYPEFNRALDELKGETVNMEFMKALPNLKGNSDILEKAEKMLGDDTLLKPTKRIYDSLKALGYEKQVCIDLALARELDYYSGPVFEIYLPSCGKPVGGGGRYDGLLTQYGIIGQAMGFALDLEVIASVAEAFSYAETALVWTGNLSAESALKRTLPFVEKGFKVEMSWVKDRDLSLGLSKQRKVQYWVDLSEKKVIRLDCDKTLTFDELLGEEKC